MKHTHEEVKRFRSDNEIKEYYNQKAKHGDGLYFNGETFFKVVAGKRFDLKQTTLNEVA